jgi:outer membrane protein
VSISVPSYQQKSTRYKIRIRDRTKYIQYNILFSNENYSIKTEKNLMMKITSLFLGLFLFANTCSAELKIGYVNGLKVMEEAPQAEKAKKTLEKEFSPKQKQLVAQQKEIKQLEEKLSRDASVMGETERRNLERDIVNKKRETVRSQQEFSEDFNLRKNEELGKLNRRIAEAIKAFAKEGNYDLLLTDGVIHSSDKIDVTSEVQKKLVSMPE